MRRGECHLVEAVNCSAEGEQTHGSFPAGGCDRRRFRARAASFSRTGETRATGSSFPEYSGGNPYYSRLTPRVDRGYSFGHELNSAPANSGHRNGEIMCLTRLSPASCPCTERKRGNHDVSFGQKTA